MTMRYDLLDPTDPVGFQPEQLLTEVAAILAAGVLRMRGRRRAGATRQALYRQVRQFASGKPRAATWLKEIPPESGETTWAGNKDLLFKQVVWRIQSLAEGGLSERALWQANVLAHDVAV